MHANLYEQCVDFKVAKAAQAGLYRRPRPWATSQNYCGKVHRVSAVQVGKEATVASRDSLLQLGIKNYERSLEIRSFLRQECHYYWDYNMLFLFLAHTLLSTKVSIKTKCSGGGGIRVQGLFWGVGTMLGKPNSTCQQV